MQVGKMKALLALRSVGFCVGQRQMCLNVRWAFFFCPYAAKIPLAFCRLFCFFTMNANGWRYETLGVSELLHQQGRVNFDARTKNRITTQPPMFYDRVLAAGDLFASLFLQFICFSQSFTIIFVLNKLINTKRLNHEQK